MFRQTSENKRLPPGLPIAPSRALPEESKKWKSTRENPNYSVKFGKSNSSSKLNSAKEGGSITPSTLLNFSRQISSNGPEPRDDELIPNVPHTDSLSGNYNGTI